MALQDRLSSLQPSQLTQPEAKRQPLWLGPSAEGWNGGVTQSMLSNYLACRERFRVAYVLGLQAPERWERSLGYGSIWHVCEEALAANPSSHPGDPDGWGVKLRLHATSECAKFPFQREEIQKWWRVCLVQFPEYVKHWREHPDVLDRQPLMQEQAFDVPYQLPSGRTARLRGKFDSVDLIPSQGGVYLQENKTTGDIDTIAVQKRLTFDLQTMTYITALHLCQPIDTIENGDNRWPICGVRYNVVRRPLSGGKGSIRPHTAKEYKNGRTVPAESDDEFFERLRRDYIAAEPDYWFVRFISKVSPADVERFKRRCLEPLLENLCDDAEWWLHCLETGEDVWNHQKRELCFPDHGSRHFQMPFGAWSPLLHGSGSTEYDSYLETGNEGGLQRRERLFPELETEVR